MIAHVSSGDIYTLMALVWFEEGDYVVYGSKHAQMAHIVYKTDKRTAYVSCGGKHSDGHRWFI